MSYAKTKISLPMAIAIMGMLLTLPLWGPIWLPIWWYREAKQERAKLAAYMERAQEEKDRLYWR